jgi:ribose-phosphate pyrophosphokinase
VESATTELTRLPGLEVAEAKPEVKPEHWIETGPSKRLMLFSGRSHPELAQRIAEKLGIQVGDVSLRTFADGNTYCRYEESIRGADLFIVRQDKKSRPREPITAKLIAEMLQTAGADRVLTMDLHAGQIQGFFDVPVDHMTALPMLAQYVRDLGLPEELVAVAPDTGRTRLASKFAEMIGGDLAVLQKDRPAHNVAQITNVIGDVDGKCCVMTDDMVDTAGTLVAGAEFLKQHGAKMVYASATHGIFSPPAIERIEQSPLDKVIVTDTVPIDPLTKPERVTVLPIADILAETIHNIFADDSVSAIFGDMNALF